MMKIDKLMCGWEFRYYM